MRAQRSERSARHISPMRVIRRPAAAAALVAGLIAAGGGVTGLALASQTGHSATPLGRPSLVPVPAGRQAPGPEPTLGAAAPPPVRLIIPVIGVSARLIRLGLTAAGQLQAPASTAVAGWYTGSPPPGAIGSSVIGGHIDSIAGPGVFFRLRLLRPGNRIYVQRRDGKLVEFRVTAVHQFRKAKFPTQEVYGPTPDPQLRLITCGGTFDYATGHYLSNVVVFAIRVSIREHREPRTARS
ncbi:MAG: class F sortase [Streptosporangiaceae bacterium]